MGLGKDHKLGHVGHTDDLSIYLGGEVHRFLDLSTVYEPEPRRQRGKCWELGQVIQLNQLRTNDAAI